MTTAVIITAAAAKNKVYSERFLGCNISDSDLLPLTLNIRI